MLGRFGNCHFRWCCYKNILNFVFVRCLPQALFGLQSLLILGLSDNELTVLPSAVSNLANLREVDISKNGECRTTTFLKFKMCLIANLKETDFYSLSLTRDLDINFFLQGIIDLPESLKNCKCLEQFDASVNPIGK